MGKSEKADRDKLPSVKFPKNTKKGLPPGAKRTPAQREKDFDFISRLYLRGRSQQEIADELNKKRPYALSRSTIHSDLKEIHTRWLQSSLQNYDQLKAQELAKINELEATYWEGWERSLQTKTTKTTQRTQDQSQVGGNMHPSYARIRSEQKDEESHGDINFLKGIERCIDQRAKILGLYAPERFEIMDWREAAQKQGFPVEVIDAKFKEMIGEFSELDDENETGLLMLESENGG